jgi:uncharacterized membrane protein
MLRVVFCQSRLNMKKLIVAGAAMLAATLVSGNAFAVTGGEAKGLQTSSSTVNVACSYCHRRHSYRGCGCGGCVRYVPTYTGCGCGGGGLFGGGWGGGGGGGFFGIF